MYMYMYMSMYVHVVLFCELSVAVHATDYCISETFSPRCGHNEVIVVQSADYGRMAIGRCVATDFGYVGCSVSVLHILDARCSGRRRCDVRVIDPELEAAANGGCEKEFKSYLIADYVCQTGKRQMHHCF